MAANLRPCSMAGINQPCQEVQILPGVWGCPHGIKGKGYESRRGMVEAVQRLVDRQGGWKALAAKEEKKARVARGRGYGE